MKIIKFETENFKSISAAEVKLDGKSLVVTGGNAQGKSSLIDAIEFAIVGKKRTDDPPVKKGEDKAKILLETDELIISRTITSKGNHVLKVEGKDGVEYKKPQTFLDKFYHSIGLTPAMFLGLSPEERFEAIMQAIGKYNEYSELRSEFSELYDTRRELKRDRGSIDIDDVEPVESGKIKELEKELEKIEEAEDYKALTKAYTKDLSRMETSLKQLEEEMKSLKKNIGTIKANKTKTEKKLKALGLGDYDRSKIQNTLQEMKLQQALYEREEDKLKKAKKLEKDIEKYEKKIAKNRQAVAHICEDEVAKQFPEIKGIKLEDGEIYVNDIPMSSMSTSEQLRLAAVIMSKNAEKNDIFILKDGNDFDDASLKGLIEYAEKNDKQVIIERINAPSDMKDMTIEIKEGRIKGEPK